ncbi:MAG: c-type cytochrome [Candidatus Kryptoniota bacterium]
MEFLENLVIPQSNEHLELLHYLFVIALTLFQVYSGLLLVGGTLAIIFERQSPEREEFVKDLIDLVIPNKGVLFALGIIPTLTVALIFIQIFAGMKNGIPSLIVLAFFFYLASYIMLYAYKYSIHLRSLVELSKINSPSNKISSEMEFFDRSSSSLRSWTGKYGMVVYLIGTVFFFAAFQRAGDSSSWTQAHPILTSIFNIETLWKIIEFANIGVITLSVAGLFFFFRWNGGILRERSVDYNASVRKFLATAGIIAAAVEPLLVFIDVQTAPANALSEAIFGLAGVTLFIILMVLLIFYSMLKESTIDLSAYLLVGAIVLVAVSAAQEESIVKYSTRVQAQVLSSRYEQMIASLTPAANVQTVSGEDIYNGRCSACHRFDRRLVGPPYNEVLGQFVGKMNALEDFIMNPRQVLPGYPPMPNQGLKPAEVKAVAEYIMSVYLKTHPQSTGSDTAKTSKKNPS